MIRTQVQLSDRQVEMLKARSARDKVSVAELVRQAVDLLAQRDRLPSPEEQRRRAIQAAGRFASGRQDVSTRHDDYLAEAYGS